MKKAITALSFPRIQVESLYSAMFWIGIFVGSVAEWGPK